MEVVLIPIKYRLNFELIAYYDEHSLDEIKEINDILKEVISSYIEYYNEHKNSILSLKKVAVSEIDEDYDVEFLKFYYSPSKRIFYEDLIKSSMKLNNKESKDFNYIKYDSFSSILNSSQKLLDVFINMSNLGIAEIKEGSFYLFVEDEEKYRHKIRKLKEKIFIFLKEHFKSKKELIKEIDSYLEKLI